MSHDKRKAAGGSADQPPAKRHEAAAADGSAAASSAAALQPESTAAARESVADAMLCQAERVQQRSVTSVEFAGRLRQAAQLGATAGDSMRQVMRMLTDDSKRDESLINLSHGLASGESLLTLLIQTLRKCTGEATNSPEVKSKKQFCHDLLKNHADLLCSLIARPSSADERHPDEAGALMLLASLMSPRSAGCWSYRVAEALISRGCDIEARTSSDRTPLQQWANYTTLPNACTMLLLLEHGADIDAPQKKGWTLIYSLCSRIVSAQPLRELAKVGWLAVADLTLPGVNGETALAYPKRICTEQPDNAVAAEKLDILYAVHVQCQWSQFTRPAISARLQVHEQLVPDIAELILDYVAGRQRAKSAAAADHV